MYLRAKNKTVEIVEMEQIASNLYKKDGKYYRLYAQGITPNGCWLISPEMRQLIDIDNTTGKDICGFDVIKASDITGTVSAQNEYVRY
ncbi:MAG: hypothetical protein PVI90_16670 [Desulfobacteraceae bacterium]|jgi:hypothetical protein